MTYDAFISYKSDYREWVETLAANLETQGFHVCLDKYDLIPGSSLPQTLCSHIKDSRKGIVVVTPGSFDSGWVRMEYDQMIFEKQSRNDFNVIPVVAAKEVPDHAFIKTLLSVDFRDPDPGKYSESLYRLVCALQDRPPGPQIELKGHVTIPRPIDDPPIPVKNERDFVRELFQLFDNRNAVVLLSPEDRWQECVRNLIQEQGESRFGEKNTRVLVPLFGAQSDMADYFKQLGEQCGFIEPVNDAVSFLSVFRKNLPAKEKLLLVIRGFENSSAEGQRKLADVLRTINEEFSRRVRILISGGEKLADLANSGVLSYLNHSEICEWPEVGVDEAMRICKRVVSVRGLGVSLDNAVVGKLLEMSGGHPGVLEQCVILYGHKPGFTLPDLVEVVVQSPNICRLFLPFGHDSGRKDELKRLLGGADVGALGERYNDTVIKNLYWKNLLKRGERNRRLYWRSEALRLAGREILIDNGSGEP